MAMPVRTDAEAETPVVEAIRGGDRYAFGELMRRQNRWVRSVVFGVLGRSDCVDDVCQQVWTSVWLRISELRDASAWRPWLYRLARNAAVDAGRDITRRRLRTQGAAVEEAARPQPASSTDRRMAQAEQHREVLSAIQGLPAIYREPFVLRHVNGWSYKEIASVMELPVDTVETRLVRARRLLRETLKDRVA